MLTVRVTFDDGRSFITAINGSKTDIREYYLGHEFQFGDTEECPRDLLLIATNVEFLDRG